MIACDDGAEQSIRIHTTQTSPFFHLFFSLFSRVRNLFVLFGEWFGCACVCVCWCTIHAHRLTHSCVRSHTSTKKLTSFHSVFSRHHSPYSTFIFMHDWKWCARKLNEFSMYAHTIQKAHTRKYMCTVLLLLSLAKRIPLLFHICIALNNLNIFFILFYSVLF